VLKYLLSAAFSQHLNFRTDMSSSLLHVNGTIQWLSATPQLPIVHIVPGHGKPLNFRPDHLLASSPLLRDLLPAGFLLSSHAIYMPDVSEEDLQSALNLLSSGVTDPIYDITKFNRRMGAI